MLKSQLVTGKVLLYGIHKAIIVIRQSYSKIQPKMTETQDGRKAFHHNSSKPWTTIRSSFSSITVSTICRCKSFNMRQINK